VLTFLKVIVLLEDCPIAAQCPEYRKSPITKK